MSVFRHHYALTGLALLGSNFSFGDYCGYPAYLPPDERWDAKPVRAIDEHARPRKQHLAHLEPPRAPAPPPIRIPANHGHRKAPMPIAIKQGRQSVRALRKLIRR